MTADIKGAKEQQERLADMAEFFEGATDPFIAESVCKEHGADLRWAVAELSRLEGENERLREAIGLSSVDIFSDLMDLYADPNIDRLTYAAAKAIVTAEESARQAEAALADARRQIAERDEALKPFGDAYRAGCLTMHQRDWERAALLSSSERKEEGPATAAVAMWREYEDELAEVITDSLDADWTGRDGAKAVIRWLERLDDRTGDGRVVNP